MPYVPVEIDRRKKGSHKKTVWVRVRVSELERETFGRMAEDRGVTMSEMIRSFMFQKGHNEM